MTRNDFIQAMEYMRFTNRSYTSRAYYKRCSKAVIKGSYNGRCATVICGSQKIICTDVNQLVLCLDNLLLHHDNTPIFSADSSKTFTNDLVRVKSSNLWSYGMQVKDKRVGDLYIQFKNKFGGPGDVYRYYDVPIVLYRRLQSAPSKGHFFWVYVRNHYRYSKLTGDKRGRLPNAVS